MGRNKSSVVIKAYDEEWRRPWRHFYWTQVVLSTLLIYSAASYKALLSGPEHSSLRLPGGGDSSSIGDRCDQWLISAAGITGAEQRLMTQDISLWISLVAAPPCLLPVRYLLSWFLWLCVSCHVGENMSAIIFPVDCVWPVWVVLEKSVLSEDSCSICTA